MWIQFRASGLPAGILSYPLNHLPFPVYSFSSFLSFLVFQDTVSLCKSITFLNSIFGIYPVLFLKQFLCVALAVLELRMCWD
ncbi:hypothetical protein LEMLEM_LOCUS3193 [Lemmus lemmus]